MHARFSLLALAALASTSLALPSNPQLAFLAPGSGSSSVPALADFALDPTDRVQLEAHIQSLPEPRWVRLATGGEPISITEGEKALLTLGRTRFEDVTDELVLGSVYAAQSSLANVYPTSLSHSSAELKGAFELIDLAEMEGEWMRPSGARTACFARTAATDIS